MEDCNVFWCTVLYELYDIRAHPKQKATGTSNCVTTCVRSHEANACFTQGSVAGKMSK